MNQTYKHNPRTRSRLFASACFAAALAFVTNAQALLLTSDAGYTGPMLDLSAYATGDYNFTYGPAPIPGGITFVSNVINPNSPEGSVLGQGDYGLAGNGIFGGDAVYAGLDGPDGYISFLISTPVSSFGAYLNYAPGAGDAPTIGAYDDGGNLLEEWDIAAFAPISTPGGINAFSFRGIQLDSAVISELRLSGSYIIAAASADGAPSTNPPPTNSVPDSGATIAMFGSALLCVAALRRRIAI